MNLAQYRLEKLLCRVCFQLEFQPARSSNRQDCKHTLNKFHRSIISNIHHSHLKILKLKYFEPPFFKIKFHLLLVTTLWLISLALPSSYLATTILAPATGWPFCVTTPLMPTCDLINKNYL